jgi:hypothetical protein
MTDSATGFLEKATSFVKNPLGIIGLFIALIYGAAVTVSGASSHLTEDQRWVLIAFAAVFPNIVLGVFYRLVTKHHSKLYAPSDWRDERLVFGPQTVEVRQAREQAEVREIVASDSARGSDEVAGGDRTVALPDGERKALPPNRIAQLHLLVREAEDLVFARLAKEFQRPIYRDVQIEGRIRSAGFDGVMPDAPKRLVGFEVKFVRHVKNVRNQLESLLATVALAAENALQVYSLPFELILILVTDDANAEQQERIKQVAAEMLAALHGVRTEVRVYSLEELRQSSTRLLT